MRMTFIKSALPAWEKSGLYKKMVSNRCVRSVSDYGAEYQAYSSYLSLTSEKIRQRGLEVKSAMLCGAGESSEEISLLIDSFAGVREIHVIDWHLKNLSLLANEIMNVNPMFPADLNLFLHRADLRNLKTVAHDSIDFAFANKLFDLYEGDNFQMQMVLAGIGTALKIGGVLFSFDYPYQATNNHDFYQLAFEIGLQKMAERTLVKMR
jgi:hypothetical protein